MFRPNSSTTTVLVTGAAGTLGQALIPLLLEAGATVRALSRRSGTDQPGLTWLQGDVTDPAALERAVQGVDVVVHLATNAQKAGADLAMGRAVVTAARAARVPHLVYMSIVSLERMPGAAYCRDKLAVEQLVVDSGVPHTILRATQFHELVALILGMLTLGPVTLVPSGVALQPVDSHVVAQRLAELTLGDVAGRVEDLYGPEALTFEQLAQVFHRTRGVRKVVWSVPIPLPLFRAWRGGAALPTGGQAAGQSWKAWCQLQWPGTLAGEQRA
ncbi:SDR family oxidoreductase [Deinococcus sp. KSM4-11]|uniref:SDR family oxidoreductase n=1 Tax=Deinococcus sp. KSM4-11 TaxID=2568654 RepID=UPI001454DB77|nr:SDR family oxidoreductase [Deinococcus sp. KSM4-11]